MKKNYSIEEILSAVSDLQSIKKDKKLEVKKNEINKNINSDLPDNTLKLIEEAEQSKINRK
tara:strand:+ start:720 stop:902 length:183 start_codon:yes stop_codon:yes gene_type:complete